MSCTPLPQPHAPTSLSINQTQDFPVIANKNIPLKKYCVDMIEVIHVAMKTIIIIINEVTFDLEHGESYCLASQVLKNIEKQRV